MQSSNDYKLTLRNGSDAVSVSGLNAGQVSLFIITDRSLQFTMLVSNRRNFELINHT
jgi:hypothetical protein